VQATVAAPLDQRSGTVYRLPVLEDHLTRVLTDWDQHHLDREAIDFRDLPSTGENIVAVLWRRLDAPLDGALARVRLFETENNRFTVRVVGGS
jgi:6-pyruvoyl-tetrahydropterin synthase